MSASDSAKSRMERILRLHEQIDALKLDIRQVYAEEKADGGDKTAMGEVVAYLRKIEKKGRDAIDERGAMFDLYLSTYEASGTSVATHAHAPDSYSEAKGRVVIGIPITEPATLNPVVSKASSVEADERPATSFDAETGVITDNQKSEPCLGRATEHSAYVGTAPDENPAQDDVGATASSTDSNPQPTKGESDAKSAHDDSVFEEHLIGRRRQDAATAERQQPTEHENAPTESAADTISVTNSNSPAAIPLGAANSAGEAPSSSQASPATYSPWTVKNRFNPDKAG